LEEVRKISKRLGLTIITAPVATSSDVVNAARSIIDQVQVFLVGGDNTVVSGVGGLLTVAEKADIPVFAVKKLLWKRGA